MNRTCSTQGKMIEEKGHLGGEGVCGSLLFKWILEKQDVRVWKGFKWLGNGSNSGFCEHGKEYSSSKNCE